MASDGALCNWAELCSCVNFESSTAAKRKVYMIVLGGMCTLQVGSVCAGPNGWESFVEAWSLLKEKIGAAWGSGMNLDRATYLYRYYKVRVNNKVDMKC